MDGHGQQHRKGGGDPLDQYYWSKEDDLNFWKRANQAVAVATLTDDDTFQWQTPALSSWAFIIQLKISADVAGGIKFHFEAPSRRESMFQCMAVGGTAGADLTAADGAQGAVLMAQTQGVTAINANAVVSATLTGQLYVDTVGGRTKLQWAKNVAAGGDTSIIAGSWGRVWRVG